MNNKSILGLFLVLIAVMAIGSVSASDLGSVLGDDDSGDSTQNQTVTIDGIDFNVPAGFEEVPNETLNATNESMGVVYTTSGKLYENGTTSVVLLVVDYGDYNITDEIADSAGGDAKTINNVKGYLSHDGDYTVFNYAKNNKLVVISTNDESAISDFLIG